MTALLERITHAIRRCPHGGTRFAFSCPWCDAADGDDVRLEHVGLDNLPEPRRQLSPEIREQILP